MDILYTIGTTIITGVSSAISILSTEMPETVCAIFGVATGSTWFSCFISPLTLIIIVTALAIRWAIGTIT